MSDHRSCWILAIALLASGCATDVPSDVGSGETHWFSNVASTAGLRTERAAAQTIEYLVQTTGSGVAVGDYDGDGDEDLYFPRQPTLGDRLAGRSGPPNELYRNNGDGSFTEVAEIAGVALRAWSNAAYFVDYDNDGDQDLFVANWGTNRLYSNLGDGRFTEISAEAGIAGAESDWTVAAAFGDLDQDGLLDLFVVNYCDGDPDNLPRNEIRSEWQGLDVLVGPRGLPGQSDRLYRNNGDATFSEISELAGLPARPALFGMGLVMQDLDRDEDLDLFVANDSAVNQLWRNDGKMPFVEIGASSATATDESADESSGRGADLADFNEDGFFDLFVSGPSHGWNTLLINEGGMRFRDGTFEAGLSRSWELMGWGAKFLDFDNDGRLDLAIANGHIYPQVDANPQLGTTYRQPNQLLRNRGDGRFEAIDDAAWNEAQSSRGLAVLDYDMDGDLDVVVTHIDAPPSLLRNEVGSQQNWITVRLEGTKSNRDGIGAWMELEVEGRKLTRQVNPFGSFQSQSSLAVHFGTGDATFIDKLSVHWPSERTFAYEDLRTNRFYTIREGEGIVAVSEPSGAEP